MEELHTLVLPNEIAALWAVVCHARSNTSETAWERERTYLPLRYFTYRGIQKKTTVRHSLQHNSSEQSFIVPRVTCNLQNEDKEPGECTCAVPESLLCNPFRSEDKIPSRVRLEGLKAWLARYRAM